MDLAVSVGTGNNAGGGGSRVGGREGAEEEARPGSGGGDDPLLLGVGAWTAAPVSFCTVCANSCGGTR